jgi:hypothetical protein
VGQITPDAVEGAHAKRSVGIVADAAANRGGIGVVQPPGLQVSEHRQRHRDRDRDRIRPIRIGVHCRSRTGDRTWAV